MNQPRGLTTLTTSLPDAPRRWTRLFAVLGTASAVFCLSLFSVTTANADPYWTNAIELPGIATLNQGAAAPGPLVCTSSGNCISGGEFQNASLQQQAFLVQETSGTWGSAMTIGEALNVGGAAEITAISCPSDGNCTAAGAYTDLGGTLHTMVINQVSGTWGFPTEVPDYTTLAAGDLDVMEALSCTSATSCVGVGEYGASSSKVAQPLIFTETNGVWGTPTEVPGFAAFNPNGLAVVDLLSCPSVTSCVASGIILNSGTSVTVVPFFIDEVNGVWGSPQDIPGLAVLDAGNLGEIEALSCPAPGECSAGGDYIDKVGGSQAFVINEVAGVWGNASQLFGTQSLGSGLVSNFTGISCPSAGDCSAIGTYADTNGLTQPYVISESNHAWGPAAEAPGLQALNSNAGAVLSTISCSAVGVCSAGGAFQATLGSVTQAFLINQSGGTWANAIVVPGSAPLNSGGTATVAEVSCSGDGSCGVEGSYTDAKANTQLFVVNSSIVAPTMVSTAPRHVTAIDKKGVVTVRWTAPANIGGTPITSYTVVSVPKAKSCTTKATSCAIRGLNKKVHYSFEVRATNADGASVLSAKSNAVKAT
jgi:hypothetical protein